MNYTENLSLGLPGYGESADVAALNRNSGILDAYVYNSRQMECEPYDSTKTYMSGDLAIHNEVIYECNTDNTTGTWDDSKWDSTNLAEQIAKAKQSGGGEVTKEASGNPIEITDGSSAPLVKCSTSITGSQNLHGYDKPWVGGAGKNKLEVTATSATVSGVTFTVNDDGTIVANGTAASHIIWTFGSVSSLSDGTNYILSGISGGATATYRIDIRTSTAGVEQVLTDGEVTFTKNSSMAVITIRVESGYTMNNVKFYPMIRLSTVTDPTFEPYSNICPITAYTEGEIEVSDGDGNVTAHTTTYPSAIYRGSEDVVKGSETHDMVVIDLGTITWGKQTYNFLGTIPGIKRPESSQLLNAVCSAYEITAQSTQTPNTISGLSWTDGIAFWNTDIQTAEEVKALMSGVMLAYELATPTTSSVTPTNLPIRTLSGYNHIESSTGDMEIEYITEEYQPLVDLIQSGTGHTYSTSEQVVGKWIDGKDLYERTFVGQSVTSNAWSIDVTSIGIENAFIQSGFVMLSNNIPININEYFSPTNYSNSHFESGYIKGNLIGYTGVPTVTLRYTKTTTTRSLSTSLTSQKAQIETLTDEVEEVPTEEEKAVNEEENTNENR